MFYHGIEVREEDPRKLSTEEKVAYIRWVLEGRREPPKADIWDSQLPNWLKRQGG